WIRKNCLKTRKKTRKQSTPL
ncbi:hypothetical protein Gotur_002245, partial [Gossypium turneri]